MEHKRVRPSQVRLDKQNPRLPEGVSSQHEAINRLLDEGYSSMLNLARDLVQKGESNPTELPILMREEGKYIALEGNRRFAALKLLASPDMADNEEHRRAFRRLAGKGDAPDFLMCAIASSRDEARPWISLRHTGANAGVGVRNWNPQQIAIFGARSDSTVDSGTTRSITIADELEEAYARDIDLVELIKRVRSKKLTNIGRFFAGDMMGRLRISVKPSRSLRSKDQVLWSKRTAEELHEFFSWAFSYIENNSVDAYKNPEIRHSLLDKNSHLLPDASALDNADYFRLADYPLGSEGVGESGGSGESGGGNSNGEESPGKGYGDDEGDDSGPGEGAGSGNGSSEGASSGGGDETGEDNPGGGRNRGGRREARPEKRIFQDLKLPHLHKRIQFLLKEVRQLEHEESPGIACVMARVVVELAVSDPQVLAWSGSKEDAQLRKKIFACLRALDPHYDNHLKCQMQELNPVYLEVESNLGIQFMHQFVHRPQAFADPQSSRRISEVWRHFLIAINNRTGEVGV